MVVQEQSSGTVLTGALAGVVAAIAGGVVWALIVRWTEYEIGFIAWGIGFIVGTAVVFGARNAHGLPFQVIAVLLALIGIAIGKYLSFVWLIEKELTGVNVPIFSANTFDVWWEARADVWTWWDLLWVGLAVYTALRIPQVESEPAPVEARAPDGGERRDSADAPPIRPGADSET